VREIVFFGIVFVLWLVKQGSPPPLFHCWCHAVVKVGGGGKVGSCLMTALRLGLFSSWHLAFFNTPVMNCWIVEFFGVFLQLCAHLLVGKSWICTPVFHRIEGKIQQYRPYVWGSPNKITSKTQPELNMYNTVSILVWYSSQCLFFNKHVCRSSNCMQMLGIGM
jgi:hypothetical protein